MKFYHEPMSRDEFDSNLLYQSEMEVMSEEGNPITPLPY
jgi:hypothetical protein